MSTLPAPALMVLASLLFATMGVCVKFASAYYSAGEIVFYRGLVGIVMMAALMRSVRGTLRTTVPAAHFWRSVLGVSALCTWFYSIGGLPLGTAMTLNYMSSVWLALFLVGGAVMFGAARVDGRVVLAVLVGFAGVAMILRPTIADNQLWHGLIGLLSGVISAVVYMQITTLSRAGEPEYRIVFYFSVGGVVGGAGLMALFGMSAHTALGLGLLLTVGVLATTAQMLMTRAYGQGSTLVIACLQYTGIAFAFIYGVLLFNDPLSWFAVGGMVLIVVSGIAATLLRQRIAPLSRKDPPPMTETTT